MATVADSFGQMDPGAHECQRSCGTNDTIFCNGFESP